MRTQQRRSTGARAASAGTRIVPSSNRITKVAMARRMDLVYKISGPHTYKYMSMEKSAWYD